MKNILPGVVLMLTIALLSCEKIIGPENDNHSGVQRLYKDAAFAEGLLLNGYAGMPNSYIFDEIATDDAATNVKTHVYLRMATGEWAATFTPISVWTTAYRRIFYLNSFLDIVDSATFSWDDRLSDANVRNQLFRQRFKGEALALRAWYHYDLLKKHGGVDAAGQPLGVVIMDKAAYDKNDADMLRSSYEQTVQFILSDLDGAAKLLPDVYANGSDLAYNTVFGVQNQNRVNGLFIKALRSRLLLHVASMSFNTDPEKWQKAANAAAVLLKAKGGIAGLSATGVSWWKNSADGEILFRRDFQNINSREIANFPPSLFGNGETNPSQNLVDAFPTLSGYPIAHPLSGYNVQAPYANRDPRLKAYILHDGNTIGANVIRTGPGSVKDGLNQTPQSTRTGYYLKKLLQETVSLDPKATTTARHFYTVFRYTEIFLNYAEAANEAWGPQADPGGNGFTPVQILAAIRKRAGITQPDAYLNSIAVNKEQVRALIRNERRIELCFEGFHFWDMRRWNEALNEPVKGVSIQNNQFTPIEVENRNFEPFMQFAPIPYEEILKGKNLQQNKGW